jgi:nucleoside-diphosphate-sugar epimerase
MFNNNESIDKPMTRALIGHTGFVGGNLKSQQAFDDFYNSKNISDINGKHYDALICAGVSAVKWMANSEPEKDRQHLDKLIKHLKTVTVDKFILISTVDVYPNPVNVDENSAIDLAECHPYGKHRIELEKYVNDHFDALIVRLPGLFGNGLKKNIIYDFLNDNNIEQINPNGRFQFYYLEHLSKDINIALKNNLKLVNITTEPTNVSDVAKICLGKNFESGIDAPGALYDYKTIHASLYGGENGYMYDKQQVLSDLKRYVEIINGT